jgi:anaerobic ribonucleoside-triphosphate reductase activating protein
VFARLPPTVPLHNPQTHEADGGYDCSIDRIVEVLLGNPLLSGVTFSGGEPFAQAAAFAELADRVRALDKNIVVYSGYTFEQLLEKAKEEPDVDALLHRCDWLIDGPFIEAQRDLSLLFAAVQSGLLDLPASLRQAGSRNNL